MEERDDTASWWTTQQAAQCIGITPRAVHILWERGRLAGMQHRQRAWVRINPESAVAYRDLRHELTSYATRRRRTMFKGDRWRDMRAMRFPVYFTIVRVAKDKTWADVRFYTWAKCWSKRMVLPFPDTAHRYDWTEGDLDRDTKAAMRS